MIKEETTCVALSSVLKKSLKNLGKTTSIKDVEDVGYKYLFFLRYNFYYFRNQCIDVVRTVYRFKCVSVMYLMNHKQINASVE